MSAETRPFHVRVAEQLIQQLREGVAPWQRPWDPARGVLPMNPSTGNRYRGINAIHLMAQQREDPRWLTYRQAQAAGAQVRKGERGTPIQFWKFTDRRQMRDANGAPRRDEAGRPIHIDVKLARPRVFTAVVFSAQQMEGLPEFEARRHDWEPLSRAEEILRKSGATIEHSPMNRAFYRPSTDTIHLPEQTQFSARSGYYATALHELGHWTGHPTRLARDLAHPFGSVAYAREELRAEIASMIMGHELGVGHDSAAHASYVGSWVELLQNEPLELFRAAADAEKINSYVLELTQAQQQVPSSVEMVEPAPRAPAEHHTNENIGADVAEGPELEVSMGTERTRVAAAKPPPRHYLAVPYEERQQAKALGAAWDAAAKCWYARAGVDRARLAKWEPSATTDHAPPLAARAEFASVLTRIGCLVDGDHPILDGKPHRIRTEGDKGRERAGFYVAHADGVPAGYCKNNRTGEETSWRARGFACSPEERAEFRARALRQQQQRELDRQRMLEATAARLRSTLDGLLPVANERTPYLQSKGVASTPWVLTDRARQTTYVPAYDINGRLWSMQYIQADGTKRFARNSRKDGCFHPIHGHESLPCARVAVVAEGYATAATLSEVLGEELKGVACLAAFDSGNVPAVAAAVRERYPELPIVIAADDDQLLERAKGFNPGMKKAKEAADAVGGRIVSPTFAPGEETRGLTDFNDLATRGSLGKDAVRRQVLPIVRASLERSLGRGDVAPTHERVQHRVARGRRL